MSDPPRYTVRVADAPARILRRLPRDLQRRLVSAIDNLTVDPRPRGAVQLKGQEQVFYRIRVGDWRIIYTVEDAILVLLIVELGPRGRVYRDF